MPTAIFIGGLPGTGKSFLAGHLAERLGYIHLNTDLIRNEMGARGKYDPQDKQKVYAMLSKRMDQVLSQGKSVIIDATFQKAQFRNLIRDIADKYNCEKFSIITTASDAVIEKRVAHERQDSEADYGVYIAIKDSFDPIEGDFLILDTDNDIESLIEKVKDYMSG